MKDFDEPSKIIRKEIGFNYIWDLLKKSIKERKIILVGHNLLIDLFFIY